MILVASSSATVRGRPAAVCRQITPSTDAVVIAHYAADVRNIWAYLHGDGGDHTITVADEGDLAAQRDRDRRVAVYGIQFDFNKSSIRADSSRSFKTSSESSMADAI